MTGELGLFARRYPLMEANRHDCVQGKLLKQVDGLRDLARRSRRLSPPLSQESDRERLDRHAEELEESASRIEGEAASARPLMLSGPQV